MANCTGFTHIAFEVEDVEKVFGKALNKGAVKLGEVTEKTVEGIGVLKFVYFRDPEGNIIEIQSWKR
jgi:catechol 2,3-dioxygenase-like lactoylglutathione lyase family enzyme